MKSTAKSRLSHLVKEEPSRPARDGQETSPESSVALSPPNVMAPKSTLQLLPRVIRLKDAPGYLGMDRNRFNTEVRPGLVEFPIGTQGIGFDRLGLDAWLDDYKQRNGRPGHGGATWQKAKPPALLNAEASGTSTNESMESAFAKALKRATTRKRNATSRSA